MNSSATVSTMSDSHHSKLGDDDQSQRYAIIGLTRGYTKKDLDWAGVEKEVKQELYRAGMPGPGPNDHDTEVASFARHL
jgi:hypothetical protein